MPRGRYCPVCGELTTARYCPKHQAEHQAANTRRQTETGRSSHRWKKLSAIRRQLDGMCLLCGSTTDLTVHLDPSLGGNHWEATLSNTCTLCRRCHTGNPQLKVV